MIYALLDWMNDHWVLSVLVLGTISGTILAAAVLAVRP